MKYKIGDKVSFDYAGPDMTSLMYGSVIYVDTEHIIVRVPCRTKGLAGDFNRNYLDAKEVESILGKDINSVKVYEHDVFVDMMNPFTYLAENFYYCQDEENLFAPENWIVDDVDWDTVVLSGEINGYTIVERDGKYNFCCVRTGELISELWYDKVLNFFNFKGTLYSLVMIDGDCYRIEELEDDYFIGAPCPNGFAFSIEEFLYGSLQQFTLNFPHCIGSSHMGNVTVDATCYVGFDNEELEALVALMKSKNSSDVEVLNLKEELPQVYDQLEEAIKDGVIEAEMHHWLLEGFYEGAYEYDVYEVMEYCEENCGFEFSYDEDEYLDDDGELDEDALEDAKQEAFDEWLPDYIESLDLPERSKFIQEQLNGEVDMSSVEFDYDVFIPEEIVKLSGL